MYQIYSLMGEYSNLYLHRHRIFYKYIIIFNIYRNINSKGFNAK